MIVSNRYLSVFKELTRQEVEIQVERDWGLLLPRMQFLCIRAQLSYTVSRDRVQPLLLRFRLNIQKGRALI